MALIDKASLLMVPSTYEDGTLYNVLPSGNRAPDNKGGAGYDQTRADFTFDRGNNLAATRIDENGVLQKGRENVLLQSNQFDTTWLNQLGGTITSGQSGYDGSNNAWLISKSASNFKSVRQVVSWSGVSTFSVYAKAGTLTKAALRMDTSGGAVQIIYDLSLGVVDSSGGVYISRGIENVGNGWYRIFLTVNVSSGTNVHVYVDRDGTTAGNIIIQNAQLEKGLIATEVMTSESTTAKAGILEDMPRINYDANGENGALLLEPLRSNLLAYSEYYDAGQWAKTDVDLTTNYALSPEGKMNASLWEFTTTNTLARIQYVLGGVTTGATYTQSYYIKSLSGDLTLRIGTSGAIEGEFKDITATSEWQRFDFTSVASGTTEYPRIQNISGTQGAQILVYGAQMEAGSYPSSYIPTHGAAVSRSADDAEADNISDLIGQTEGTLLIDAEVIAHNGDWIGIYPTSGSAYQNGFLVGYFSGAIRAQLYAGGTAYIYTKSTTNEKRYKIAITYTSSSYKVFIDGVKVHDVSKSTTFAVSLDRLAITGTALTGKKGNVKHKEILMFPTALTDAECVTLTTL